MALRGVNAPIAIGLAALALVSTANAQLRLKPNDRILFYGDSITEQRLYTTYTELFLVTRYPKLNLTFAAVGVGGDRTTGGWMGPADLRVKRDVAPEQPTVITVMLGMNDGNYAAFDQNTYNTFTGGYEKLLAGFKAVAPEARYTLIGPSPYDDIAHPDARAKGYDQTVGIYGDYARSVARANGYGFADFRRPVNEFVQGVLTADPTRAKDIIPDAVHPGPAGHLVMAAALLKAWNVDGTVSDVTIDISSSKATAKNATVTGLKDLTWKQTDAALPFPIRAEHAIVWANSDLMSTLNRQQLTVTGLSTGKYTLQIDGKPVVTATDTEWASGFNLANYETPMRAQANQVFDLAQKRNDLAFDRWRNIDFNLSAFPKDRASRAVRDLTDEIGRAERKAAQPVTHTYQLVAGG